MQSSLLLCLMLPMIGCGRPIHDYKRSETLGGDPHLVAEYYTQMAYFQDGGVGEGDDLKVVGVQYGPLPNSILGLCSYTPEGRVITLRYDLVKDEARRHLILTHEMGHCVYNQSHYDADIDIMNTVSDNEAEKETNFESYFYILCQRILGK